MSNINKLTFNKFCLDVILTKSEAEEVVPEKEIVKYMSNIKSWKVSWIRRTCYL